MPAPPPSRPPPASPPALDGVTLDALCASRGADVVRDLIRIFVADSRARCDTARDALARGDFAAVVTEAHTLRGAAATLGAAPLAAHAGALEQAAEDGDPTRAAEHHRALARELTRVHDALAAHPIPD